jgi:hypothetical protein
MSLASSDKTMPTLLIEGYKFRFYSFDIDEPPHMHVSRGSNVAKVWLQPVRLEYSRGYSQRNIIDATNRDHTAVGVVCNRTIVVDQRRAATSRTY